MAIGVRGVNAAAPIPAWSNSTTRISSVAYAVDEMASEANAGRAMNLRSRWCCSSALESG